MTITLETRLCRNGEILHATMSTEGIVMLSMMAGKYYGLNSVGARIWELLETPRSVAEICATLCEEFDVDARRCEVEVLQFTSTLVDNGIVNAL